MATSVALALACLLAAPAGASGVDGRTGASKSVAWQVADAQVPAASTLELESGSADVQYVAGWVKRTGDNGEMPYLIIDKVNARVFLMDASGRLQGEAPALLGMVQGDGSAAGIGDRKMSAIAPEERTTPAGRYLASLGQDLHGQDILWIDYDNAIALHRIAKGTPLERRAQRLQSETSLDNRISYGCINVPVKFYEGLVRPTFIDTSGVVYILPEMSSVRDMFKSNDGIPSAQRPSADAGDAVPPSTTQPAVR